MAIVLDAETRVIVQGITGNVGRNAADRMRRSGSPLVGGVTPGRGGVRVAGVPVFDSSHEAVARTGASASFVCVPGLYALEACLEALDAGIGVLALYPEGVPLCDVLAIAAAAKAAGAVVIGPNAAGCVSPGYANLSDLNDDFLRRGPVGLVSKSGAISYETAHLLAREGLGVSTIVCLGGDPILCTDHAAILRRFEADPQTRGVVMIGEVGGGSELLACEVVRSMTKPVVAHVLGRHAPRGKPMGHAGAVIDRPGVDALTKSRRLAAAGATVVPHFLDIGHAMKAALSDRRRAQSFTRRSSANRTAAARRPA